jgi:hypothetical protein
MIVPALTPATVGRSGLHWVVCYVPRGSAATSCVQQLRIVTGARLVSSFRLRWEVGAVLSGADVPHAARCRVQLQNRACTACFSMGGVVISTSPMEVIFRPEPTELECARQQVLDVKVVRLQPNGRAARVLFVTSEAEPFAKSGGRADVSRAFPAALIQQGIDVRVLLPGYPGAIEQLAGPCITAHLDSLLGVGSAALISGHLPDSDVPVWLVHAPSLFSGAGGLYQDDDGQDWIDNALRFAFFARVAAEIAMGRILDWKPGVVHANDWHAELVPLLLRMENGTRPATGFTIHNLAFQGNFPREVLPTIGIPEPLFADGDVEFCGQVSYLKAAIRFSDRITTVSSTCEFWALCSALS